MKTKTSINPKSVDIVKVFIEWFKKEKPRAVEEYSRGFGTISLISCLRVLDTIHKASLVLFDFLGFRNSWLT